MFKGLEYISDYVNKDKHLGIPCIVDGRDVYDLYNADLIEEPELSPENIDSDFFSNAGGSSFYINYFKMPSFSMSVKFYVGGSTSLEAQTNYSKFISYFNGRVAVMQFGDTEFEYVCSLKSFDISYTNVKYYYLLSITFNAIKRLPKVSAIISNNISSGFIINNVGTKDSGVILVIDGTYSSLNIVVNDNTINVTDIPSGKILVLDGLDGVIAAADSYDDYKDGDYLNLFLYSDIIVFPKLLPGVNNISVSGGTIQNVIIEYYPLFIL